jgi:hypothetical protein
VGRNGPNNLCTYEYMNKEKETKIQKSKVYKKSFGRTEVHVYV